MRRTLAARAPLVGALAIAALVASCDGGETRPHGKPIGTSSGSTSSAGGSGGGGASSSSGSGGAPSGCGDGVAVAPEQCDGADLGDADCTTIGLGFETGSLACRADCTFDTSGCSHGEKCSDGLDNDGDGLADCLDPDCAAACADGCSADGIVVMLDPSSVGGDTRGHANLLDASCTSPGGSGPEIVYQVTPAQTGVLELALTSQANLGLSTRSACDQPAELGCRGGAPAQGAPATLRIPVDAGVPVFVVVQGYAPGDEGPFDLQAVSHTVTCGDGFTDASEACDDGDAQDGDGCSAGCQIEAIEIESNDDAATATPHAIPYAASIAPAGDVDFIAVDVPFASGTLTATVRDFDGRSCAQYALDSAIAILDADGATALAANDDAVGSCSRATAAFGAAGVYYVRVAAGAAAPGATFGYLLDVDVSPAVCGDGVVTPPEQCDGSPGCDPTCAYPIAEVEPNDTTATASPYVDHWHGAVSPTDDVDLIAVAVPGPSTKLYAAIGDDGSGRCLDLTIISRLELLAPDGATVLAADEGSGSNYCGGVSAAGLPAGTHYLRVSKGSLAFPSTTFPYELVVTLQ